MEYRVLIVEDEENCQQDILLALKQRNDIAYTASAYDVNSALALLQQDTFHIVFLDIDLGSGSGFEVSAYIGEHTPGTEVIFLTGHTDFALEGYRYHPVDYLIKPVSKERLNMAFDEVKRRNARQSSDAMIGLHTAQGFTMIKVRDILYIERTGRKTLIHTVDNGVYRAQDSLKTLESIFSPHGFYRSHQSYLVPLDRIHSIRADRFGSAFVLNIDGTDSEIPLSRENNRELRRLLEERTINK